jgi:hypothetical protein
VLNIEVVAVHEAGHAIIRHVQGLDVYDIWATENSGKTEHEGAEWILDDHDKLFAHIVAAVAGAASVKRFLPQADWRYGAGSDYVDARNAAILINSNPDVQNAIIYRAEQRAWALVEEHELMIGFIAQVLKERTVTGREIRKLYGMCRDTQIKRPPVSSGLNR